MKFRKRPVVIEATQWFKNGDHPDVLPWSSTRDSSMCEHEACRALMIEHGRVGTLEGFHIVCPGDWIITGVKSEIYPCKPDIFEATYEQVAP